MKIIEPLNLSQDGVAAVTDETFTVRWYAWDTQTGLSWMTSPVNRLVSYGPEYACDVVMPALMCGDAEEIRGDVSAALHRHARRLGLTETA